MATIEGRNPVIEAIKNDREIDKIMIANSAKEGSIKKIIGMAKEKNIVIQYVDKNKLDEPIMLYYNVANPENYIIVSLLLTLGVTVVLLIVGMIIKVYKKNKKSDEV